MRSFANVKTKKRFSSKIPSVSNIGQINLNMSKPLNKVNRRIMKRMKRLAKANGIKCVVTRRI